MVKKVLFAAGLSIVCAPAYAQFITSVRGVNDIGLQNVISSRVYAFNEPSFHSLDAGTSSFFSDMDAFLNYSYEHWHSKLSDGTVADVHSVTPGIYLEHDQNTSITAGFSYSHADGSASLPAFPVPFNTSSTTDSYGVVMNADQEVLHFFGADTTKNSLTLEADFGYSHSDLNLTGGGFPFFAPVNVNAAGDTYDVGSTIIFIHPLIFSQDGKFVRLNLTLSPAYDYNVQRSDLPGLPNTYTGLFTGLARLDYGITSKCFLGVYGSWERIVHQNFVFGGVFPPNWARAGAVFSYKPCNRWLISAGYFYEAFNTAYDSHNVTVHAEFHF